MNMFNKQTLVSSASLLCLALAATSAAWASEAASPAADSGGFYGGISMRGGNGGGEGVSFGPLNSVWNKFTSPVADDTGSRALTYGGYRWANDIAVEAALATTDRFLLKPALPGSRRGVGLALAADGEAASKAWNVDVYTSWEFRKSLSLYGRLGYAQSEFQQAYVPGPGSIVDARRSHDGVNYGLGLRYDMSPALGLRLEYARFGRLPGEISGVGLPENDQLQLGVQFRF
jgi:opacity protein-like surface antigen